MLAGELIRNVYRKVTGEYDETIGVDDSDGLTILSVINEQVGRYYTQTDNTGETVIWRHSIDPEYEVGFADMNEDYYEFDEDVLLPIVGGVRSGVRVGGTQFFVVDFQHLYDKQYNDTNVCAITEYGLTFRSGDLDDHDGDPIYMPVVKRPGVLLSESDDIFDITGIPARHLPWLLAASAAEYCRTDIVRGAQYSNILADANDMMDNMIAENAKQQAPVYYRSSTGEWGW